MKIKSVTYIRLVTLVCNLCFITCSNFVVQKFDGLIVDPAHLHNIKNVVSKTLLQCIDQCKKLITDTPPNCNAVVWDDKTSNCELAYGHQSSLPKIGLFTSSNTEAKNVIFVPSQSETNELEGR